MKKEDLDKSRKLLIRMRDQLTEEVSQLKNDNLKQSQKDFSGDLSGYSLHLADMGSDDFGRATALSVASNEQDIIYENDEAIARIDEGTFGKCECGKLISKQRLNAIPYARLCIECKAKEEKQR